MWGSRVSARAWATVAFAATVLVATSCGPPPVSGPATIGIATFSASTTSGPSPLTTTFTWLLSGPESPSLTCTLDADGDGTYEITINHCSSSAARSVTVSTPGSHLSRLRLTDGTTTVTSAPVTLTVGAAAADSFGVTLRFDASVTMPQRAVFEAAATRWSQVIRTGLADVPVNAPANECGTGAPAFNGTVDDVLIDASVIPIDGVSGVLGQAGPCLVRTTGGLPAFGAMQFDSADVADLMAQGRLYDVILHEMGHVLGFGTVWESFVTDLGGSDPRFTGLTARGTWSALTGGTAEPVPVEATGGPGTAGSHWRETVFGSELMTGWISTGTNPLSQVTVGALADLGYGVDLNAADSFPWSGFRDPNTPRIQLETELIYPTGTVG